MVARLAARHSFRAADTLPSMATSVTKRTVTTTTAPQTTPMRRLVSLDVVRGITIAFMILVNNGGSGKYSYSQLEHSAWNGWTLTDLVFPSFLFIAGISIVFSNESRMARGESKAALRLHVIKRSLILFLLGLVVNGFPLFNLGTLRIYGVLQRIAICFLFASLLYLWNSRAWIAATTAVVALLGYWILMRWVPIPGIGVPTHGVPLLDPNNNWVAYVDRKIFPGRLYEGTRDPEGLISNIPAMGTILFGVLTGIWLRRPKSLSSKAAGCWEASGTFGSLSTRGFGPAPMCYSQQAVLCCCLRSVSMPWRSESGHEAGHFPGWSSDPTPLPRMFSRSFWPPRFRLLVCVTAPGPLFCNNTFTSTGSSPW
jgi:hypothetical protein